MIITINQKNLKNAISAAEKIISRNASLPILQNIVLKTENGRLKISSTNLEIGINYWIGAKIEEDGEIAVPARIFSDFINNINDEKITINSKNNVIGINSENYKTKIIGFSVKDFPIIPKTNKNPDFIFSNLELIGLLSSVIDSTAVSETRPELSGILMNFSKDKIESAATDSFRLAEKSLSQKNHLSEQSVIIPRATVFEVIRIFSETNENISLTVSDNQIFMATPNIEIVSRLIDGSYPDYKKVIPDKFISRVITDKEELGKSIRLASIFTSQISDIRIKADEEYLKVTAQSADRGEISSRVGAILKNEPFEVAVNYRYFLDGLKIMPTDKVIIEFTGEGNPLVIKPEDRKDLVYIIMPLRN